MSAETSAHASRHEAMRFQMTILAVRPNHRAAGAVGSIHYSFLHINPLAIDARAIVTVLTLPIGIVYALHITAIAARSLSTAQAFIPKCSTHGARDRARECHRL